MAEPEWLQTEAEGHLTALENQLDDPVVREPRALTWRGRKYLFEPFEFGQREYVKNLRVYFQIE